ncbi:MAG: VTT domain-containing protein [Xanthomonadales bacterium]|nr:VTT domain-containing protein [Xanthomonadales bacterium]
METDWTRDLLNWMSANPGWAGFWVFLMSFVESLAFVGILVPGILILFGLGALISFGALDMLPIWLWGSVGAFAGDFVSYAIGRRYKGHLAEMWPFSRFPKVLERGRDYFNVHGPKSVVVGRFIGPLRPVIPVTAGMMGLAPRRFFMVDIPACIVWTPSYLIPGMLFGASLEVASEYAGRLSLVLIIGAVVLWLTWWIIWTAYEYLAGHSARWMRHVIRWMRRHPVFKRIVGPLLDSTQPEVLSVTMMGLLLVLIFWGMVMLLFMSPFSASPQSIDQSVQVYALTLRNHIADPLMVALTQLSRLWVLIPTSVAVLLWLIGAGRQKAALHWLVAMGGGVVLQILLGWSLRSTPILSEAGFNALYDPSAALTLVTVVLGYFAVMVARELKRRKRKWPYVIVGLLLSLLVLARLYLGLDWLSGALMGLALGMAWTFVVGIAYRQRAMRSFNGIAASLIFFGMLAATFAWQVGQNLEGDLAALRLPLPQSEIAAQGWWESEWQELPRERTHLPNVAAREFNFQFAGDAATLARVLAVHGWQEAEPANWRWSLLSLNPEPTELSLPPLKRDYLGHANTLLLHRLGGDPLKQETIRIWDSGFRLTPGGLPLYLGQINDEILVQRMKVFSYWRAVRAPEARLEQLKKETENLQTRSVSDGLLLIREP